MTDLESECCLRSLLLVLHNLEHLVGLEAIGRPSQSVLLLGGQGNLVDEFQHLVICNIKPR